MKYWRHAVMAMIIMMVAAPSLGAQGAPPNPAELWRDASEDVRAAYYLGLHQAFEHLASVARGYALDAGQRPGAEAVLVAAEQWRARNTGDPRVLVQMVSEFYAEPANNRISWFYAFHYSLRKVQGDSPEELERYLLLLRRQA